MVRGSRPSFRCPLGYLSQWLAVPSLHKHSPTSILPRWSGRFEWEWAYGGLAPAGDCIILFKFPSRREDTMFTTSLTTRVFHSKPDSHWFQNLVNWAELHIELFIREGYGKSIQHATHSAWDTATGMGASSFGRWSAPPCHLCHLFSTTIYLIRPRPLDIHPPFILWLRWCPYYSMGRFYT